MRRFFCLILLAALGFTQAAHAQKTLFQKPALNRDKIVFSYAGDLWVVGRDGGEATRLTAGTGTETNPQFSPDGATVAFTGEYDGNVDVYVVPVAGGEPKRLTFHPSADSVAGWTPDGKNVLFRSTRASHSGFNRLYTISTSGGFPEEIPLPTAELRDPQKESRRRLLKYQSAYR